MSDEGGVGADASGLDSEIVKSLLDLTAEAEDGEVVVAGAKRVVQILFAQIAAAKMKPSAIRMIMETESHPMFVRRFAALDGNGHRQSWSRQEERTLKRYAAAQERMKEAKTFHAVASESLRDAEAEFAKVNLDMALIRLSLMLRGMQEFVRPALEAGPLVTLMLAVLSDASLAEDGSSAEEKAEARRTLDVLAQRVGDDPFLEQLGQLVRGFVTSYDDEAGAEGRLTPASAERLRRQLLADAEAMRALREVAAGGEISSDGEAEDDRFSWLP